MGEIQPVSVSASPLNPLFKKPGAAGGTRYRVLLVLGRDRIRLEFMETSTNSTEVEEKGPGSRRIVLRGASVQSGL